MSHYEKAWQAVATRVADAARASGRDPQSVHILAVSKTFPADAVRAVHACGQRVFGESYVREGEAKRAALVDLADIEWRLIGPVQSNKAARAARAFDAVESVDRLDIARRLSAACADAGAARPLDVLVQVNISGEAQKRGVRLGVALPLAHAVAKLPMLALRGFMGSAAAGLDEPACRVQFRALKTCLDTAIAEGLRMDTLSMGKSADLEAAIAEGATEVRVGSAIFGARARDDEAHVAPELS
ncbi:MAG: YggS family pyridoxal phosphate-dependent enzyme [Burkholderiales bacterium]